MRKQYPYLEDAYYENAIIATKKRNFLSKLNDLVIQKQYVRITLLNWEEEPLKEISGQITSGSITKNGSSAMRTTGNMSATFDAGSYSVEDAQADFALNKKIYVEIGLRNDTGEYLEYPILWFPQGVFFISSFSVTSTVGGINVSITLKDKMAGLNGDVGGKFSSTTILDTVDDIDENGNYSSQKVLLYDLIMELVNHFGGEPLNNIVIEDVDLQIKRIMKWNGDTPLYIWETTSAEANANSGSGSGTELTNSGEARSFMVTTEQPQSDIPTCRAYDVGSDVGYILDDFYYTSDLTAAPGDSVVTILDKIKSYLGNYEYFYDIYGIFHFREIKNYLNTTQATTLLEDMAKHDYLVETTTSKSSFSFSDDSNLVSITCTPQYDSIKNDFIVQGKRQSTTDATYPVMYHLAIDNKPTTGEVKYEGLCLYQNEDEDTIEGCFPTILSEGELPVPGDASRKLLAKEDLLRAAGYNRISKEEKIANSLNMLNEFKTFFDKDTNVSTNETYIKKTEAAIKEIQTKGQTAFAKLSEEAKNYINQIEEDKNKISKLTKENNSAKGQKTVDAILEDLFSTSTLFDIANGYFSKKNDFYSVLQSNNSTGNFSKTWTARRRNASFGSTDSSKVIGGSDGSLYLNSGKDNDSLKLFSYCLYKDTSAFYPECLRGKESNNYVLATPYKLKRYVSNKENVNTIAGIIPGWEASTGSSTCVTDELTPGNEIFFDINKNGAIESPVKPGTAGLKTQWSSFKASKSISDDDYVRIFLSPYYEDFPLNVRKKACEIVQKRNNTYLNKIMMREAAKERINTPAKYAENIVISIPTLEMDYKIEGRVEEFAYCLKYELQYIENVKTCLTNYFKNNSNGALQALKRKYGYVDNQEEIRKILDKEGQTTASIKKQLDSISASSWKTGSVPDKFNYVGSSGVQSISTNSSGTDGWLMALLRYTKVNSNYPLFARDTKTQRDQIAGRAYIYHYGSNVGAMEQSSLYTDLYLWKNEKTEAENIVAKAKTKNYDLLRSIYNKYMKDYTEVTNDNASAKPQTNVDQAIQDIFTSVDNASNKTQAKIDAYNQIKAECQVYVAPMESLLEDLTTIFEEFCSQRNNRLIADINNPSTAQIDPNFINIYLNKVKSLYRQIQFSNGSTTMSKDMDSSTSDTIKKAMKEGYTADRLAETVEEIIENTFTSIKLLDTVTDNTVSYIEIPEDSSKAKYGLIQWSNSCYKFLPIIKYYGQDEGYVCKDWRTEIYMRGMMAKDGNGTDASQYYNNLVTKVASGQTHNFTSAQQDLAVVVHNDSTNVDFYFEELQSFWPQIYDLQKQEFVGDAELTEYKHDSLTSGNYFLDFIDASSTELNDFSIGNIGRRTDVVSDDNINCLFEPEIPDILYVNTDEISKEDRDATISKCKELGYGYVQIPGNLYYAMYTGGNHNAAFDQIKYELYVHTLYQKTLSITAIPAWFLQPNTRCTIDDKVTNTYGDFNIQSITLTLGAGSTMSVTLNQALERI